MTNLTLHHCHQSRSTRSLWLLSEMDELTAELGDEAANYTFVVKGFCEVLP
ncbi:MAG: hypothetical protein ABGW81_08120 [Paracoccaceae bacterium]